RRPAPDGGLPRHRRRLPARSRVGPPGYPLRMSARDPARFRLRYLRKGTRSFWAWGTRGHDVVIYVVIMPALECVAVQRGSRVVPGQEVSHAEFSRLLRLILDARE